MNPIGIVVVGAGYMGEAHARVISKIARENPELLELRYVVDVDENRAKKVSTKYGGTPLKSVSMIPVGDADFAVISTPTNTHYNVFLSLIERGLRGFLIEKPMVTGFSEALKIIDRVGRDKLCFSVGHTERFNPAVIFLNKKIIEGKIGKPLTYIARRVGPFTPRAKDVDVILDLGIHEVDHSLMLYSSIPLRLEAYTLHSLVSETNDYALIISGYDVGYTSIEVNRITPYKQRMAYITGDRGAAYLDYMLQESKLYVGNEEISLIFKKEEPLYIQDYTAIERFIRKQKPLVSVLQAALGIFVCEKSIWSARTGSPLNVEKDDVYNSYKEVLKEGIRDYSVYRDYLLSYPSYWWK